MQSVDFTYSTVSILQEDDLAGGVDMRFHLPATPSPCVMATLLDACRELQRAGAHSAGPAALELLEWELSHALHASFK